MAEDEHVVDDDVEGCRGDIHIEDRPGAAPPTVEAGHGRRQRQGTYPITQDAKIGDLVGPYRRVVSDEIKNRRGQLRHEQAGAGADESQVSALPDGRADSPGTPRSGVLGDEGVDVSRHAEEEADEDEVRQRRGQRRGESVRGVPREEHAVDKVLDAPAGRAQNHRESDDEELAVTARCSPARAYGVDHEGSGQAAAKASTSTGRPPRADDDQPASTGASDLSPSA